MDFNILTYKPDINIANNYFEIEKETKFLDKVGRIDEEYYHDYFGLYTGDDKYTLAHAAGAVDILMRDPSDEAAKERLITDTENYFQCVYGEDTRRVAYQLIKLCAGFGFLEELAAIVEKYHNECIDRADDGNHIGISQALDFRKIYIKIADKLLFIEGDADTALSFYKLVGADWCEEIEYINPTYHFENDTLSGLSKDEIESWNLKSELFEKIVDGYTNLDTSCVELEDYDCFKMYDDIMEGTRAYDPTSIEVINHFIDKYGSEIGHVDDQMRLFLLMLDSIKRNRGVQILYLLSQDKDADVYKYQDDVYCLIQTVNNRKYQDLRDWVTRTASDLGHIVDVILYNVKAAFYVDQLLTLLKVDMQTVGSMAYYTTYHTFSLMLPDQCVDDRKDQCGMISVMNVAYMNDPNEGQTIRKFLYGSKIPCRESERRELHSPYVFIKCFTSLIDYLPMWQMYGDAAKGVCVVTNWAGNENTLLYKVCYLNKTSNGFSIRRDQNNGIDTNIVLDNIKALKSIQNNLKELEERLVFDAIIDPILYLFKDSSYSYEQEYRMMFRYDNSNKRIRHTKQNPPKLFVLSEKPIQIDELIIGPCFENVLNTMPYMKEQLELMAEKTGTKPPKVTVSNIDFR